MVRVRLFKEDLLMNHFVVFKEQGYYCGMPNIRSLSDGRLMVSARVQTWASHSPVGGWYAFVSNDNGETWIKDGNPSLPPNWPASSNREKLERIEWVMTDGSYLCAGAVGQEVWPSTRRQEAEGRGLRIIPHPFDNDSIQVGGHKLFVQRSTDHGKSWRRREWDLPNMSILNGNRPPLFLSDGTILLHLYGVDRVGNHSHYIWRSSDEGRTWRMYPMGTHGYGIESNETGMVEVSPGRILAHTRVEAVDDNRYLLERWSDDAGKTWTDPVGTGIWGFPADLLRLRDGRIVCCYGYRRSPGGVRAVLSDDGGETWDLDNMIILRDDGGYPSALKDHNQNWRSDVGYPVSIQLDDESILTTYYITCSDRITHTAVTRWRV